jgi:subtilisin family serine protease
VFAAAQSSVFAAVADAVAKGYPVINLSLGSAVDRTTEAGRARYEAWARLARHARRHGTLLVGAAGNEATRSSETARTLPGDLPTVVGVSATGTDALSVADGNLVASGADVLAPYSNYGEPVDLAAPGGDCGPVAGACDPRHLILSTIVRPDGTPGYGFAGGTSMAAPHVAAAAGLVFAAGRRLPVDFGAAYVLLTAERLGPAEKFGRGMVDVEKAAIPASLALPRRLELPAGLAQRGAAADPG